tara:strand:+ start:3248 stop:3523 length:276 start_codon:yes stop_codon:yes gene_type:complete
MGIWALGTKKQIQNFIWEIEQLKDKYYNIAGSDGVFDGLDRAVSEAKIIIKEAEEGCSEDREGIHQWVKVEDDGTTECYFCSLRSTNSEIK